jgi:hypothetical protein
MLYITFHNLSYLGHKTYIRILILNNLYKKVH